jgi:hypothetical protein
MHGEEIGVKNAIMGVDDVAVKLSCLPIGKPGKADGGQEAGKADNRYMMECDRRRRGSPAMSYHMDFVCRICCEQLRENGGISFSATCYPIFRNNDRDFYSGRYKESHYGSELDAFGNNA